MNTILSSMQWPRSPSESSNTYGSLDGPNQSEDHSDSDVSSNLSSDDEGSLCSFYNGTVDHDANQSTMQSLLISNYDEAWSFLSYTSSEDGSGGTTTRSSNILRVISNHSSSSDDDPSSTIDSTTSLTDDDHSQTSSLVIFEWGQWVLKRMYQRDEKKQQQKKKKQDDLVEFHLNFQPIHVESGISSCSSDLTDDSSNELYFDDDAPTMGRQQKQHRRHAHYHSLLQTPTCSQPSMNANSTIIKDRKLGCLWKIKGRGQNSSESERIEPHTKPKISYDSNETFPSSSFYTTSTEYVPISETSSSPKYVDTSELVKVGLSPKSNRSSKCMKSFLSPKPRRRWEVNR